MADNMISVIDAAQKLGMRKQTLFKVIRRLGINRIRQKSSSHRGQAIAYITESDFELLASDQSLRTSTNNSKRIESSPQIDSGGFYLIQLEPDHDPGRFKLGFSSNLPERLRKHKTSAPFAKVLKLWPCHALWEKTAIDCVTQGCEKLHTEVFRTDDIEGVEEKCDQFFSLMPRPDGEV